MGEASTCSLPPQALPASRPLLSPAITPHPPPPRVSLMLTCKEFLEMLPFLLGSDLPTGKP